MRHISYYTATVSPSHNTHLHPSTANPPLTHYQVGTQAVSRAASQGLAKGAAAGLKGVNLQQTVLQAGVAGQSLGPESVLTTQHLTTLPAGERGREREREGGLAVFIFALVL